MNVLGIVAEYNPLHNGHMFQMKKCKEKCNAEFTVAVISGNFTQRGEPALLDKWIRAEMAVRAGIDLVIELPFYFACNSAEYFAKGAVGILNDLGVITHMGFGSESGDIDEISSVAKKLVEDEDRIMTEVKEHLSKGVSFPKAREMAMSGHEDVIRDPNNILGIEYVKEIIRQNSPIKPITIKRFKAGYHEEKLIDENIGSGTAIRKSLREESLDLPVPTEVYEILKSNRRAMVFSDNEDYFKLLKYKILGSSQEELEKTFSISEGLENKLISSIRCSDNLEEFVSKIKSKRYTRTRLHRICAHILVGMNKSQTQDKYIRILGFNNKGAELLKIIKKGLSQDTTLVTNVNKVGGIDFSLDTKATDIYNLIAKRDIYDNSDFVKRPVIL